MIVRGGDAAPFCSVSSASLVQIRAMSSRMSRTRLLGACSAICRYSAARFLYWTGVSITSSLAANLPAHPNYEAVCRSTAPPHVGGIPMVPRTPPSGVVRGCVSFWHLG